MNTEDDIEKKLSDLLPDFGIDLNIIENSDENGMKLAFNIRKVTNFYILNTTCYMFSNNFEYSSNHLLMILIFQ